MGIVIKNALVIVPQGTEDVIKETSLYIEKRQDCRNRAGAVRLLRG